MDNKYSKTINRLIADVFPNLKEILVVFLYGSVARGDYSLRHSDLDLFIVLKNKLVNEKVKERLDELILPL
ncbi:MAG TPA: nucleotidyltransferase domain-containing protein, partial [Candidatus Nanoarchaeia archaeon]|nr:nucleotidyltransferase domain-containing protein [Candidatus Nanoarchaeia archaeon]